MSSVERVSLALRNAGHADTVQTFPDGTRTATDAAAAVGCEVAQIAKSIIFRAGDRAVLVIASGANRVDRDKVSKILGLPVANADATWVRDKTGFAIGGVAPVGHLTDPLVVIDEDLLVFKDVWAAAGSPAHVFKTEPGALVALTKGRIAAVKL